MALTTAQVTALKTLIAGNPAWGALPNNSDGASVIAAAINVTAVPDYIVWKRQVSIGDIGDNIVGTDLAGLTQVNVSRLQCVLDLSPNGVNPSLPDRRAFFDDIFSGAGGVGTRGKLLILWKRVATVFEKALAAGTGSTASPATMGQESPVSASEVEFVRNS